MSELADKIAAEISPLNPVALETKNISDLSPAVAANIESALESELKNRSFRLLSPDATAAATQSAVQLQLTISQGTQSYILVAEILNAAKPENESPNCHRRCPKIRARHGPTTGRFAITRQTVGMAATYEIPRFRALVSRRRRKSFTARGSESDRLAYYRAQEGSWRFIQAISIVPWRFRDPRGRIDNDGGHVYVGDMTCSGELTQPDTLKCEQTGSGFNSSPVFIAGDQTGVGAPCKNREAYLETGNGDWTQADSIQGYESNDGQFSASGAPIETPGPVMSFEPGFATNTARAVVYNLNTKNYEAYVVTTTCSH